MIILIVIIMAKIIVILPFRIIEFIIISGSSRSPVTLITNPAGVEFTRMHIVTVSGGGSRRRVLRRHSLPHRLIIYATLPADSTVKFTVGSWECPIVKSWTSNDFGGIQNYDSLSISNCQGAHPWGGGHRPSGVFSQPGRLRRRLHGTNCKVLADHRYISIYCLDVNITVF